jgi:hypothetical protein
MQPKNDQIKTVRQLQRIALLLITIGALGIFLFALVSGMETFGSGITAMLENSPNTLPWLALLVLVWLAWRNKKIGGLLIGIFGLVITWFLNFRGQNFFLITFVICLSISFLGFLIWMCESLIRASINNNQK